jgi:hypothetical protein
VCFVGTNLSNSIGVDGFMGFLSRHRNGAWCFVSHLHAQLAAWRRDGQVLVSQLPHQVEGLSHRLLQREPARVRFDVRGDGSLHLRGGAEVAVGRHEILDALVRPLEVVAVHEELEAFEQVCEVREHRAGEEFFPQRLPETFHLAQRLGVVRAALDVLDALTLELGLELRLASPRRVLAAVVGERLLRHAESRNAFLEGLHHQCWLLMMGDGVADDEAAVVVHEDCHVQPLVASQQEGENVWLPELIWRGALEACFRSRRVLDFRRRFFEQAFLVKNSTHCRRRNADAFKPSQQSRDASCSKCGVLTLHLCHFLSPRVRTPGRRVTLSSLVRQRVDTAASELRQPLRHGGVWHAQQPRDVFHLRARLDDFSHRTLSQLGRTPLIARPLACLLLSPHLSLLFVACVATNGLQVLGDFSSDQTLINWRAAQP